MFRMLDLNFDHICAVDSEFERILALRREAYDREAAGERDAVDEYSHHFVARQRGEIVAALRVTCVKDGPLMSMDRYPAWVLEAFGDTLLAGSRLCIRPGLTIVPALPQVLLRFAWGRMLPLGMRVNVAVSRFDAVPYYLRQGFAFLRGSDFIYDKWNVPCGLIALTADPARPSPYADVFAGIQLPTHFPNLDDPTLFASSLRNFRELTKSAA
jgi:hypothetical protein